MTLFPSQNEKDDKPCAWCYEEQMIIKKHKQKLQERLNEVS